MSAVQRQPCPEMIAPRCFKGGPPGLGAGSDPVCSSFLLSAPNLLEVRQPVEVTTGVPTDDLINKEKQKQRCIDKTQPKVIQSVLFSRVYSSE